MVGYVAPREGGAHQPARTPMRVADGWSPSVTGGGPPSVPRRRAVIPQPFRRPSTELSPPPGHRRVWRYVPASDVCVGDIVVDIGVVLDVRGRPEVGCTGLVDFGPHGDVCWLEADHEGEHLPYEEAKAAGRLCVPGTWWLLVGPEVEREIAPNLVVRAFQLEEA